jgi:hypothetical protein
VSQRLTSPPRPCAQSVTPPNRITATQEERLHENIAVLTSGGDAPGMNAALRAVVRNGVSRGLNVRVPMKDTQVSLKGTLSGLGRAI